MLVEVCSVLNERCELLLRDSWGLLFLTVFYKKLFRGKQLLNKLDRLTLHVLRLVEGKLATAHQLRERVVV